MTEQEHSPLPWKPDGWGGIADANGEVVHIYSSRAQVSANRDLVIRAVNAHDALVAAVSELLTTSPNAHGVSRRALEALKLARSS